jgi:hypothetical protein
MWIIRVEDLNSQRDRLLSDFLDDGGSVSKNYLKIARSKTRQEDIRIYEHYKWTSTEDIVEAKVWSTKEDAIKFLESVRSKVGILKSISGGWSSTDEFFIDKKLTIEELSYQEWNLIDINNW